MTKYQECKKSLLEYANFIKGYKPNDKPLIRQEINDELDALIRYNNLNSHESNLLTNYAIKLHPKE